MLICEGEEPVEENYRVYDCPSRRESALDLSRKDFTTSTCSVSSFQRASLRKNLEKNSG